MKMKQQRNAKEGAKTDRKEYKHLNLRKKTKQKDEKKYKLIGVRKGKTNYARTNNRKNVTLGSYTLHSQLKEEMYEREWLKKKIFRNAAARCLEGI